LSFGAVINSKDISLNGSKKPKPHFVCHERTFFQNTDLIDKLVQSNNKSILSPILPDCKQCDGSGSYKQPRRLAKYDNVCVNGFGETALT
jgi:hypothetical protein